MAFSDDDEGDSDGLDMDLGGGAGGSSGAAAAHAAQRSPAAAGGGAEDAPEVRVFILGHLGNDVLSVVVASHRACVKAHELFVELSGWEPSVETLCEGQNQRPFA